jgi:hypothetical protein
VPGEHDKKDLGADQEKKQSSPSTDDGAVWLGRCLGAWLVWTIWGCFFVSWAQAIVVGLFVAFVVMLGNALTGALIPSMNVYSGKTFAEGFREGIGVTVGYLAFLLVCVGLMWLRSWLI